MNHVHHGPKDMACVGCYQEVEDRIAAQELRTRRFWGWALVAFALALAGVTAFVLYKIGRPS